MSWAHPALALAAPALALAASLLGAMVARWARHLARPVGAGQERLTPSVSRPRERLREVLLCAGLALIVLALAGPRWGSERRERLSHGCDAALLIDCSRSMLATDAYPTRSAQARRKAVDLLAASPEMRIALMPFARLPLQRCPFTSDHAALEQMIGGCTPALFPAEDGLQGTDIAAAIIAALSACEQSRSRSAAIIVLSDGGDDDQAALARAADAASAKGVPIYAIAVGDPTHPARVDIDGAPRSVDAAPKTLERLAAATGGRCWRATSDPDDVRALADAIDAALQGGAWRTRSDATAIDRYRYPLALGMASLVLGALLPTRRRRLALGPALARAAGLALALALCAAATAQDSDPEAVARALAMPPEQARAALLAELAAHPRDALARYDLGTLLLDVDPHAAELELEAAFSQADPPHGDANLLGRAMGNLAIAHALQGRMRAARSFSRGGTGLSGWPALPAEIDQALAAASAERGGAHSAEPADHSDALTLPPAMVGRHYHVNLRMAYDETFTTVGFLPPGWRMEGAQALVADPMESGTVSIDLRHSWRQGDQQVIHGMVQVLPPASISTTRLPAAVVGRDYRARIQTQGLGWAAWSADDMPAGLDIAADPDAPDQAWITGVARLVQQVGVTVHARAGSCGADTVLALAVVDTVAMAPLDLPQATVGATYHARMSLCGPDRAYRWSGTPASGLAVSADGEIGGVPTDTGALGLPITVTGGELASTEVVTVPVAPWPEIMMAPTLTLPGHRPIWHGLETTGGTPPMRWSLASGALPHGLELDAQGALIGACTDHGHAQARLRVVDRWGATAERTVDVVIVDARQPQEPKPQDAQQQAQHSQPQQKQQQKQQDQQQPQQSQSSQQQAQMSQPPPSQKAQQQDQQHAAQQQSPAQESAHGVPQSPQQSSPSASAVASLPHGDRSDSATASRENEPQPGQASSSSAAGRMRAQQERDAHRWLASLPNEDEDALRQDLMQQQQQPAGRGSEQPPW